MEADRLFHHTLYEAAGNRTLADFASLLLDRSMLLWFRPRNIDVATVNVTELETILDGFLSGDKTTVVTHMEEHILSVRAKYLGKDAG
jgi:DNA-binding GntR family transcriptional regulator